MHRYSDDFEVKIIRKYGQNAKIIKDSIAYLIKKDTANYELFNYKGELITTTISEDLCFINNKTAIVHKENGYILFDLENKKPISEEYHSLISHRNIFIASKKENQKQLLSNGLKPLNDQYYEYIYPLLSWCYLTKKNGLYGLLNAKGEAILKNEYIRIENVIWKNKIIAKKSDGIYLYDSLTIVGKCDTIYQVTDFTSSFAACGLGNIKKGTIKYGITDYNGKVIVPFQFDEITLKQNYFVCRDKKLFSYFRLDGTPLNDSDIDFSNGSTEKVKIVKYKEDGYTGLMTESGQKLTKAIYHPMTEINNTKYWKGYNQKTWTFDYFTPEGKKLNLTKDLYTMDEFGNIIFSEDGKYGIINLEGKILLDPKYDEISICNEVNSYTGLTTSNYFKVSISGSTFLLDKNFKPINKNPFEADISCPTANLVVLKEENKEKLFNIEGKEVLPNKYDIIVIYNKNIVGLKNNNKYYIYYASQNKLSDMEFDEIVHVTEQFQIVQYKGKYGLLNSDKKFSIPAEYTSIESSDIYYVVYNGEFCGLFDEDGTQLLPFEYKSLKVFGLGVRIEAKDKNDKAIVIDILGQQVK